MSESAEHARDDFARADADWSWETDERLCITHLCDRFTGATGRPPFVLIGRPLADIGPLPDGLIVACDQRGPFRAVPLMVDGAGAHRISGAPDFDGAGLFRGYRGTATKCGAAIDGDARAAFLSGLSHEFRTPLNAIIGFAEAMGGELHGPLSERYAGYARDIAQAGQHLLTLVEDILDASAIDHGDVRVVVAPVAVAGVLDKAAKIVSVAARKQSIQVVCKQVDPGLLVAADEQRFCQILVNLLGNAIKFTPAGGRATLSAKAKPGGRVAISVRDTGPGIAPEDHKRIFEKFERLDANPFPPREGAGLGLAIARELAQLMKGALEVRSVPGEGARFTLTLPAA